MSLPITPPRTLIHGILVDGKGQRFINEDTYMGRVGQSALYQHDGEVYLIVDEASYEVNWMGLVVTWVRETAAQLESETGLPPGSLQSTLDLYNRHAAAGEDPLFHKGTAWVRRCAADRRHRPAHRAGPLRAVHPRRAGDDGGRGGPRPRVRRHPGSLRRGPTTAGVCSFGYASGLSIGYSTLFGRFAGASAAAAPTTA